MNWIACAVVASALLPGQAGEKQPITNYWVHLNEILRPAVERPVAAPDSRAALQPTRTRPFDALADLRARDLVRAANEGAREARQRLQDRPEEEVERQVRANIHFCLEYYPLLVQREEDVEPLLHVMEDPRADATFRIYLFERVAPGLAPPSLFSDFLQDNFRNHYPARSLLLRKICTHLFEAPAPQAAAIAAWYALEYEAYLRAFRAEPAVAEKEAQVGTALKPASMRGEHAPALAEAARRAFDQRTQAFGDMAMALGNHLAVENNRPPVVQAQVRSTLLRILADIPLQDPEPVRVLLEAPATPPSP